MWGVYVYSIMRVWVDDDFNNALGGLWGDAAIYNKRQQLIIHGVH